MSETNLTSKIFLNEIDHLSEYFSHSKEKREAKSNILKVNQQQDGQMDFTIYSGNDQLYKFSGRYKTDHSNDRYELLCTQNYCTETIEYGIFIEDTIYNENNHKIRIEEKHDNYSNHFDVNLAFYDKEDSLLRKYRAEASYQQNQDIEPEEYSFIIHDLSVA